MMIEKMNRYEHIHSVAELLKRLSSVVEVPHDLVKKGEKLDTYEVPKAWPWGAPYKHYDEEDARMALEYAEEVIEFVKRAIEDDPR